MSNTRLYRFGLREASLKHWWTGCGAVLGSIVEALMRQGATGPTSPILGTFIIHIGWDDLVGPTMQRMRQSII